MRKVLFAAAAALTLAAGSAHASIVMDAVGDFGPQYIGPQSADLDVTSFQVDVVGDMFQLSATFAGDIVPGPNTQGFYVFGVNTGTGTIAPFGTIGHPRVRFNQAVVVNKFGAITLGAASLGTALIQGNRLSFSVATSLFPATGNLGLTPGQYGWNLWPRLPGGVNQVADFAPENGLVAAVPEPATWAMLISGFALVGGAMRHRRRTSPPVAVRA